MSIGIRSMETTPTLSVMEEEIQRLFKVKDKFLREENAIEFEVEASQTNKDAFAELVHYLRPRGYLATLRRNENQLILLVAKAQFKKPKKSRVFPILFIATIGTIAADGFIRSAGFPGQNLLFMIGLYTLGVMGIIGVHEMGHKVASGRHGMRSSMPYFIPGFPGILPTFGAVITSGEPPTNKDCLFDLGISGPISGLIITLLVAIGGALTTATVPIEQVEEWTTQGILQTVPTLDALNSFLLDSLTPRSPNTGMILSPLVFASTLGFLITFLNLMPAWQLDGGHVARAVLSTKKHRIITYASIIVLFLIGFTLMAMLILILSMRSPEMRPLDDVSPISKSRKVFFAITWIIAVLIYALTMWQNPFFPQNPIF